MGLEVVPSHVSVGAHHRLKECRHGLFLINLRDTYVGKSLDMYGEWSEHEMMLFAKIIKPGDVVVDIGANVGGFTIPFAKIAHTVVAFEPQRILHQLLQTNLALNEIGLRATAHHAAVGREPGRIAVPRVNYSVPGNYGGVSLLNNYSLTEEVPVVTLDSVFPDDGSPCPNFIKVDVEGMELSALEGGRRMLERCTPVLYVENNCKKDSAALLQFIGDLGFDMYWDIKPYYNAANYFGNQEDIFTDRLLSMNVLCLPSNDDTYTLTNFVKIRNDESGWLLSQYNISWRGQEMSLSQLGNEESCVR